MDRLRDVAEVSSCYSLNAKEEIEVPITMSSFLEATKDNSATLLGIFQSCNDVQDFLTDENIRIPLHATAVTEPDESLEFTFDFDGVVIEVTSLAAVKLRVHYLNLSLRTGTSTSSSLT